MLVTHWIAGTACTSWSDRASLPRNRAGNAISPGSKKAKQDGTCEESNPGGALPTGLCPTPFRTDPNPLEPRRHPRRPGTSPTSAPTSARDPLYANPEVLERTPRDVFGLVYILRYVYYCKYITLRFVNFRKEKYVLLFVNFR